ncbi:ewing's tumor-associated antigen 1 [Rhinophrynus dorsalis]
MERQSSSFKKTPKRLSRSKQWSPAISSPSNDAEQQHEIFWDPYSPKAFKLEKGKKKQAANKCTVDISDIVNRIAPKNEKPANTDAAYLGMWIGEDAIPSTPVVARARSKINRSRSIHTEEELMKLAKQFDKNLVETVHTHDQHDLIPDDKEANFGNIQNNDSESFLEVPPEEDVARELKSVSQSSGVSVSSYCPKPVDQDIEAAFNAIFDCSTQKCSGHLSQTLSDISTSSLREFPVDAKNNICENKFQDKDLLQDNLLNNMCETSKHLKQSSLHNKLNSPVLHTPKRNVCILPKDITRQTELGLPNTVPTTSNSQDDFDDDWGADFLADDSFVMQITQNPSLIVTPKHDLPVNKVCHTGQDSVDDKNLKKAKDIVKDVTSAASSKLSNFKFVPQKSKECDGNYSKSTEKSEKGHILHKVNTFNPREKCTTKPVSHKVPQIPLNSQMNADGFMRKQSSSTVVSEKESLFNSEASKNDNKNTSTQQKNSILIKTCNQNVPQIQNNISSVDKGPVQFDEWDDPKFSDEVLDMFCESDSLWEANEDDDDLLYQVCDDVERLSQAQVTNKVNSKTENVKVASSNYKNCINTGPTAANQRQPHQPLWQSKNGNNTSLSSTASSIVTNKFSGNAVKYNSSSDNSLHEVSVSSTVKVPCSYGSSSNSNKKESLSRSSQVPVKFSRSNSVPSGGVCTYNTKMLNDSLSQNMLQPQSDSSSVKNSSVPSKFSFTRIKHSQVLSVLTNHTGVGEKSTCKDIDRQELSENKNQRNTFVQTNHQPSLKRHNSESTSLSTKVFVSEERNKKCSMEEIERKKQEALARRKMKVHATSSDTAPS